MGRRLSPGFFAALISALVTVLLCSNAWAGFTVPPVPASNPVHDGPDVLTPAQEKAIGAKLVAFKKQHGIEVGVAIIPTLGEMSIKEAGYEIATAWGLGDKERKDGLLLLVVADKAKAAGAGAKSCGCLRFEVGEYMEGDLTDIASKEILVQEALPLVTVGKYNEGITGALKGVTIVLGGDSEAAKQYKATSDSGGDGDGGTSIPWWVWLLGIAALGVLQWMGVPILDIVLIILAAGGGRGGRGGGGGGGNSVGGGGSFGGGGGDV
jgi:uncharacterized protein